MRIYFSLFQNGQILASGIDANISLAPNQMLVVTGEQILQQALKHRSFDFTQTSGLLALVHLVPTEWTEKWPDLHLEQTLPLEECRDYCYRTDAYGTYQDGTLEKMTVGYHCLWWNMPLNPHQSTLFQGCKFPHRSSQETYVLLTHFSANWGWNKMLRGKVMLTDAFGNRLEEKDFIVPPFSYCLLRLGENLSLAQNSHYLNIVGSCPEGQILPFFISRNPAQNSYFIEHGVGPDGYFFGVDGAYKKKSAEFIFNREWPALGSKDL